MPKPLRELLQAWDVWHEDKDGPRVPDEMARRLRLLDERHQPIMDPEMGNGGFCNCGQEWPCPDRRILDGEEGA